MKDTADSIFFNRAQHLACSTWLQEVVKQEEEEARPGDGADIEGKK